jgi:hypothetical protein
MVTVSSDSYLPMVRAAQLQAIRTGLPLDQKQSVPVSVAPGPTPITQKAASTMIGQIIDVLV